MEAQAPPEKQAAKGGRKSRFRVVNMGGLTDTAAPEVIERKWDKEPWVPFGRHNLFAEFCRALADNCSPLNSSVNAMALYLAGKGLEFLDVNEKPIQRAFDLWHDSMLSHTSESNFMARWASDMALLGAWNIQEIALAGGEFQWHHLDVSRTRMGKKVDGIVPAYYWCSNWELYIKQKNDYPVEEIPAFSVGGPKRLLYHGDYKQTVDYYGHPWWLPAIADAEVLTRIPLFNRTQLDTGFRPAFHIHVFDRSDKVDLDELDEHIEAVFTGANGKSYVVTYGTKEEGAPAVTKLERGDHAGELDAMDKYTTQKVYKAYGVPPILMGDDVNTGLSGKGLALDQEYTLFIRTKVEPRQSSLTDAVKKRMREAGVKELAHVRVKQLVPFEAAADPALTRQTYLRKITVNEDRVKGGLLPLTIDGKEPLANGSNLDPRGKLLLIEVGTNAGANTNEEQDANPKGDNVN